MPIEVICQCGKRFAARDDFAGKTVACPACKAPLKIAPPRPTAVPAPEPTGVGSILDEIGLKTDERGIVCPKCQGHIAIGTSVCKRCHYNLQTASVQGNAAAPASSAKHGGGYDWSRVRKQEPTLGSVVDEELTFSDMALCGFFGCLMFPYGLILFLRGHSKGILIMLGSLLVPAILTLFYALFSFMTTTPPKKTSCAPAVQPCEVLSAEG